MICEGGRYFYSSRYELQEWNMYGVWVAKTMWPPHGFDLSVGKVKIMFVE